MKSYIILLAFSFFLFSCEKKEIPVSAPVPGDVTTSQVIMGSDYSKKIFYRLKSDEIQAEIDKSSYDLSFESSEEGWHVLLNSANLMKAAYYENAGFDDALILANANWKWDACSGNLDSASIGDWRSKNGIYLIDRGYDQLGNFLGYAKLIVDSVDSDHYYIRTSELNGDNLKSITIAKYKNLNYTEFSFDNGYEAISQMLPDNDEWDLVFTQYTYVYYDLEEVTPYQVTGVLLNPKYVQAQMEIEVAFEDIDLEYASNIVLSENNDVIGFNWKSYNFDEGYYSIASDQSYIIRDVEGIFYKLRFVDFYTDGGVKGAPKFEFQKL